MITMFLIEEPGRLLRETTKKRLGLGGVCVCMCVCTCVCVCVCVCVCMHAWTGREQADMGPLISHIGHTNHCWSLPLCKLRWLSATSPEPSITGRPIYPTHITPPSQRSFADGYHNICSHFPIEDN